MKKIFTAFFLIIVLIGSGCVPNIENQKTTAPASSENITVTTPLSGDLVDNPIHVTGEARVFENVVSWRLRDSNGNMLTSGTTEAAAPDMGQFGPFDFYVVVPFVTDKNIILEVFQASAKDGSDTDLVSIPLELKRIDTTEIELYFHNNTLDPEITCTKTFPVTQEIVATQSPARAAMILLLQGPPDFGQETNYYSTIPFRTWLKDISISTDGVATVDFDGAIAAPMGGSCLVSSISAEIENTLKQFDSVKEVKILIDGEEDRLEP